MAELIRRAAPQATVRLIDVGGSPAEVPEEVFATPTYVLNGRVVSLGNPSLSEVSGWFQDPSRPTLVYLNGGQAVRRFASCSR